MIKMENYSFQYFCDPEDCRAVFATRYAGFHAVNYEDAARRRIRNYDDCIFGFWRIKERK